MPSPSDTWTAIERRLASNWTDTPIAWPGVPFTPPNNAPWIRPTPLFGAGAVATYDTHSVTGILQVDVFAPRGRGTGAARALAETVRDLFAAQTIDGVRFGAASGPEIGPDTSWLQLIVRIPFDVDEAR